MFTKTILGAATAAFIAAGALGASATTASASGIYIGGPGIHFGYGHHPRKVCEPIYKKVKWQDRFGNWHRTVKLVDYRCWWKPYGGFGGGWGGGYWGGY